MEEADAEAQVLAVLLLLPEQLSLAVIAEGRALPQEALLHLALMWVHPIAQLLSLRLLISHQAVYLGHGVGEEPSGSAAMAKTAQLTSSILTTSNGESMLKVGC